MFQDQDKAGMPAAPSRRGLLRGTGIGALALGVASVGFTRRADADDDTAITDEDILNFALNLEYLEAEFYHHAVYGHGIPDADTTGMGKRGGVSGGAKVTFALRNNYELAREIANDELNHVLFLRSALGKAAVARPAIDIGGSFAALGQAAGLAGTFNPYANENAFLLGAFVFEDVGVTAYLGAAASIKNKGYLTAAGAILAVEAYHAAEIRTLLVRSNESLAGKADKISALRAALSNAQDDQGPTINGKPNIVPTDSNSLVFPRTPAQVLNIVYGGGSPSNYLFFPDKLNGAIA